MSVQIKGGATLFAGLCLGPWVTDLTGCLISVQVRWDQFLCVATARATV